MFGEISYVIILLLIIFSGCHQPNNYLEIQLKDVYFSVDDSTNSAPFNRIIGQLISHNKDSTDFYFRCSKCINKGNIHSFSYTVLNGDTIRIGSHYAPKVTIAPFDTIDYEMTYMLFDHSIQKSLENNKVFYFRYDSIFLENLINNEIYYYSDLRDYKEVELIPNIIFKKSKNFNVYFQSQENYKFINEH